MNIIYSIKIRTMDEYLKILIKEHNGFLNDIVATYYTKNFNTQILTYFRVYFFYYMITSYVYRPVLNIREIKRVFFGWIEKTLHNKDKKLIIKNLEYHYNYLFKIFFVDKNIYFHVYFNNLIKYFLPLPFELNIYSPIITYRNNVEKFYKKNNVDYLDKPNNFDYYKKYPFSYNVNEIDIHIPINFFDKNIFEGIDVIFLVAKKDKLYIVDYNLNILYSRTNNFTANSNKYLQDFINKKSFEESFPLWIKETGKLNLEHSFYISVMKRLTYKDLFNVFEKYDITTEKYKYLFHNTLLNEEKIKEDLIFKNETFFYLIPLSKSKYFSSKEQRHCLVFKIETDINNLLDLTSSIVSNNNFKRELIKKDKENKVWISYDPTKVNEYYKTGEISTTFDDNFKCLTLKKMDLRNRDYCDVYEYAGRRKLQEILFKTRKYRFKKLYFDENTENLDKKNNYKLYHPPNTPINFTWDFDKYILKELDINGFFFVDYGDAVDGGEVLLINPQKYISKKTYSNKKCFEKDAFVNNELE